MILVFSGWRDWTDAKFIRRQIERELGSYAFDGPLAEPIHIRVGDARGADAIVRAYFDELAADIGGPGKAYTMYVADWNRYQPEDHAKPNPAGAIRNKEMLLGQHPDDPMYGHLADRVVAFPQPGRSKPLRGSGTWNCVEQAHFHGVDVFIPAYRAEIVAAGSDSFDELLMEASKS